MSEPLPEFNPIDWKTNPEEKPSVSHVQPLKQHLIPSTTKERAGLIHALGIRLSASVDFFLQSALFGLVLSLAVFANHEALYLLAAVIAPFLSPLLGLSFAPLYHPGKTFINTLGGWLVGCLLVFGISALAGWISQILPISDYSLAVSHSRLHLYDFILLGFGVVLSILAVVKTLENTAFAANVALAYEIYIPLGIAGFGLANSGLQTWPEGLTVFFAHFLVALAMALVTWLMIGLRPYTPAGWLTAMLLLGGCIAAFAAGWKYLPINYMANEPPVKSEVYGTVQPMTPAANETAATLSPIITTITPAQPSHTPVPTLQPTLTAAPWVAKVRPNDLGGVVIRAEAGYGHPVVTYLDNHAKVILLNERIKISGVDWVKVQTMGTKPVVGWIAESLLQIPARPPQP